MSRFKRRTLAAVVGLSLGWIAAGMTFSTAHAEDEAAPAAAAAEPAHAEKTIKPAEAKAPVHAPVPGSHETKAEPASGEEHAHGESNVESPESKVALALVPGSEEQISWFKPVLGIIVALFVLAALLGWLAAIAKGPPPPEPPDEDHSHDAKHGAGHGHDAPAAGGHSH